MTDKTASKVPKIRFRAFDGEWEGKALGELLSFKNGYNAGKDQYGSGRKFINVLDIIGNNFITHDRIIGRVNIPAKDFEKYEVKFGDILFQRSSETREEVGQANVYLDSNKTAAFGGFVIRGRPLIEFDPEFFNGMLKTVKPRREITSRSGGSTRYNIGQEALEASLVTIAPTIPEQARIGEYFRELDSLIGLHQLKHGKLVTLKKAMLQKMFPQHGATTPEIRFKGFSGDWMERKVDEICDETYGGGTPRTSERKFWEGVIPWIQSSDITDGGIYKVTPRKYISDLALRKSPTKMVPENSIAIVTRVGVGKLALIEFGYAASQDFLSLSRLTLDQSFAVVALSILLQNKLHETQGTSIKGITKEELLAYSFRVPDSIAEQRKIGTYFRTLDELISKHATQLQKLQQIKSACLEKMFA